MADAQRWTHPLARVVGTLTLDPNVPRVIGDPLRLADEIEAELTRLTRERDEAREAIAWWDRYTEATNGAWGNVSAVALENTDHMMFRVKGEPLLDFIIRASKERPL